VAAEIAKLCTWKELDRRLRKTGRRAKEITREAEKLLGLDLNPLNPSRAKDFYKPDGSKITPLEAAQVARALRERVKEVKKGATMDSSAAPEVDDETLLAIIREQQAQDQLRGVTYLSTDDTYLEPGGSFYRFLAELDEIVGGLDRATVAGVRDAVLGLPDSQRKMLEDEFADVFAREDQFWFGNRGRGESKLLEVDRLKEEV